MTSDTELKIIDRHLEKLKTEILKYRESLKEIDPVNVSRQAIMLNDAAFSFQQRDPVLSASFKTYAVAAGLACVTNDDQAKELTEIFS